MTDYDGPRTGDGIVDFMLKKFRNVCFWLLRLQTNVSEEEAQVVVIRIAIAQEEEALMKKMSLF